VDGSQLAAGLDAQLGVDLRQVVFEGCSPWCSSWPGTAVQVMAPMGGRWIYIAAHCSAMVPTMGSFVCLSW
jgi:hypothetical protein